MNNYLIDDINVFINEIKNSNIYKEYIDILKKVNNCSDIKLLTDEIKNIEKLLVKTPSIDLENKLKDKEKELNSIPLYLDYKDIVSKLNNALLIVKKEIDNYITETI